MATMQKVFDLEVLRVWFDVLSPGHDFMPEATHFTFVVKKEDGRFIPISGTIFFTEEVSNVEGASSAKIPKKDLVSTYEELASVYTSLYKIMRSMAIVVKKRRDARNKPRKNRGMLKLVK